MSDAGIQDCSDAPDETVERIARTLLELQPGAVARRERLALLGQDFGDRLRKRVEARMRALHRQGVRYIGRKGADDGES